MSGVHPLYTAVGKGTVFIQARSGDSATPGWPLVKVQPTEWNMGHPTGALLEAPIDVDATANDDPVIIDKFVVRDANKRSLGEFAPLSPITLEPGSMMRLSRAILVPRAAQD